MRGSTALAWGLLACVAQLGGASDTIDIFVKLYVDGNCFERADDFLLLDEGCYANPYSNASRAFKLKITKFQGDQEIDFREYIDDCNSLLRPKRVLPAGRCTRFTGSYYAVLETRYRSNACKGSDCSRLSVAVQSFYAEPSCRGLAYEIYQYPLQGECMRWSNGTQTFRIDDSGTNISQVDHLGDDNCRGSLTRSYSMTPGNCYPLVLDRTQRSFSWTLEGGIAIQLSNGASRSTRLDFMAGASLALAMALAHHGPGILTSRRSRAEPLAADAQLNRLNQRLALR